MQWSASKQLTFLKLKNCWIQLRSDDIMLREGQAVAELQQVCMQKSMRCLIPKLAQSLHSMRARV